MNANTASLKFPVGLELELAFPGCHGSQVLFDLPKDWKHSEDASASKPGCVGCEIISGKLTSYETLVNDVKSVTKRAEESGYEVSDSGGLHVHIGFKQVQNLAAKYCFFRFISCYEDFIYAKLSPHAKREQYCKKLKKEHWDAVRAGKGFSAWEKVGSRFTSERYYWVNPGAMFKHGTLEFRIHNGTLNEEEILNWVCFLQVVMDAVTNKFLRLEWFDATRNSQETLIRDLLLNRDNLTEIETRAKLFIQS